MSGTPPTADIGKIRGLQRIVSEHGTINACALDVLDLLVGMLDGLGRPSAYGDVVRTKYELIAALSGDASAILTDAQYGLPAVAAGALDRSSGLIVTIEDEDHNVESPIAGRRTVFREGWSVARLRRSGADAAKLLWFYRPDRNPATADHQRRILREVSELCAREGLPLVVEPIWYPLPDEDSGDASWKSARVEGIVRSAVDADMWGADVIKAEFPGYLDDEGGAQAAEAACALITSRVHVPWVVLSGGVTFDVFKEQLRIACGAGASGYLAGRALWRDVVEAPRGHDHEAAVRTAIERVRELNAITREHARPYAPALSVDMAIESIPERWYLRNA
jgi:tagatose 1,6-diphosphate aldolase